MTERIDRVEERAQQGHERFRDEMADSKSQAAKSNQAKLVQKTDQCLAESLAQATKESEERDSRMTREIERLLNDHDNTYAQTMTKLEKRLDAKADLMMRQLDDLMSSSNQENCSGPRENSWQAADGFRAPYMQRLLRDREQVLSPTIERDLGKLRRGQVGGSNHVRGRRHIRGTFAFNTACQIGSRFAYRFA